MNADEEYVRARWERVIVCDGSYRHYAKGTILLNWANHQFYEFNDWSAARAFTEQREREIAEVREEISETEDDILSYSSHDNADSFAVIYRYILARLQAVLAELRRGMKEGSES